LERLIFPGKALVRRLGEYVSFKLSGNRRLEEVLITGLDPLDGVQELDQVFS